MDGIPLVSCVLLYDEHVVGHNAIFAPKAPHPLRCETRDVSRGRGVGVELEVIITHNAGSLGHGKLENDVVIISSPLYPRYLPQPTMILPQPLLGEALLCYQRPSHTHLSL